MDDELLTEKFNAAIEAFRESCIVGVTRWVKVGEGEEGVMRVEFYAAALGGALRGTQTPAALRLLLDAKL